MFLLSRFLAGFPAKPDARFLPIFKKVNAGPFPAFFTG
jgi:hypothetical protein